MKRIISLRKPLGDQRFWCNNNGATPSSQRLWKHWGDMEAKKESFRFGWKITAEILHCFITY